MILHDVDDVLRDIEEFIRKAPISSGRARRLRSIKADIENIRKIYPDILIRLSITEIGDLLSADIDFELSD